jgi:hypothetical protein
VSRTDRALLLATGLAALGKAVTDSGGPPWLLHLGLLGAAGCALLAALRAQSTGWLDRPRAILVLLCVLELPGVYGALGGDGYEYYALLRSPLIDHDLDFANDYAGLGARPVLAPDGSITSRVLIGQALAWAPAFALAHVGTLLAHVLGSRLLADGFSAPYLSAVTTATFLLAFGGLLLVEARLRRSHGAGVALVATLGLWLATPLHFYAVANPFMSHGCSTAAACALVFFWLRGRERDDPRDFLLAGLCGGLLALIRLQDAVLLALPILDLALRRPPRAIVCAARFLVGPALGGVLQLLVWLRMYGLAFVSVTAEQNWVAWGDSQWLQVLFSPRHGLFTWTPLFLVAALGLLGVLRRDRTLGVLALLGFALSAWANGLLLDWWGSDAFGQRRLLCLLPLLALGLGEALAFAKARPLLAPALLIAGLALWNRQWEYIHNSELLAAKDQGVTLDRLAAGQADVLARKLARWEPHLPHGLWLLAYDNLRGVWLDEGPWRLRRLDLGPEDGGTFLGEGWYPPAAEGYRATRSRRSRLRVPIRHTEPATIVLRARAEPAELATSVSVRLNGQVLGEAALPASWGELSFAIPPGVLLTGFNDIDLVWSETARGAGQDGRNTAAAVDWLELRR